MVAMISIPPFQTGEIILFTPFIAALGGVERLLLGLSRTLHSLGRSHRIVCFEDTINLPSYATWPIAVQQLKPRRSAWAEARALKKFLTAADHAGAATPLLFDIRSAFYAGLARFPSFVLHLTDPPSLLPTDASKRSLSARRSYAPFASLPRASWRGLIHSELVHQLNRRGARRAQTVLAMTHRIANELKQLYGVKAEIVRPGVLPLPTAPRTASTVNLSFLSVSRLEESKRIDWILEALGELEASAPSLSERANWQLHVVGEGSQRQNLQNLAASKGLRKRVVFHGLVTDSQLEELYAGSDLFLMPAVQGYGLPALEALARNVPVILHRDSGVAEILQDTQWAEIIEIDARDLSRAISSMVARLQNGDLDAVTRPAVPTETQWSYHLADHCGWNLPQ